MTDSSDGPDNRATSLELLRLARAGDRRALNELFTRNLPVLQRWAHGRLPGWARTMAETADLVQDVMLNVFRRLDVVEVRRKGALQAYLRQAIRNRVSNEFRSLACRPGHDPLDSSLVEGSPSPLDLAMDADMQRQYAAALERLRPLDRELIVGRLELGYSYEQLALATNRRGAETARIAVRRALLKLADEMSRG
jgi:RNA polymerase sigma factor (sigma-70 family)